MDQIITGTESPPTGMTASPADDITPFPSPAMGALKRKFSMHKEKRVIAYVLPTIFHCLLLVLSRRGGLWRTLYRRWAG